MTATLQGSEKQVAYATKLRESTIKDLQRAIDGARQAIEEDGAAGDHEGVEYNRSALSRTEKALAWFEALADAGKVIDAAKWGVAQIVRHVNDGRPKGV